MAVQGDGEDARELGRILGLVELENHLPAAGQAADNLYLAAGMAHGVAHGLADAVLAGLGLVHYAAALGQRDLEAAIGYAEETDLMLVGGTSLVVYPVAGLVEYLRPSAKLVILNRDPTPYDSRADLILRGDLAEELEAAACP